jgi:small-conductance mechanosensitive channel
MMTGMKHRLALLWGSLTVVFATWYYGFGGIHLLKDNVQDDARKVLLLVTVVVVILVIYSFLSVVIRSGMHRAGAKEGEATMILGLVRGILFFIGGLTALNAWFSLGALGAIFAAFGGMFLGWALQAPVSGLAAWILISIIRPFSVGDRVQLPSQNMVGDVIDVTPLYTILNQVGGSVGSEEPANRTILVPNAMLFSTLLINYTPKNQSKLMEDSQRRAVDPNKNEGPSYMLDEFVLRITFDSNWNEAERILLEAAREVTADVIRATGQEPYIRADMNDWYGVFIRLRFMTIATERPKVIYELTRRIHGAVQSSGKVDMAIPYVYSYKRNAPPGSSLPPGQMGLTMGDKGIPPR